MIRRGSDKNTSVCLSKLNSSAELLMRARFLTGRGQKGGRASPTLCRIWEVGEMKQCQWVGGWVGGGRGKRHSGGW